MQVGNVPSNLRVVDYSLGFTGSAHDATAFEHTAAALHPDWMFKGPEFAYVDSAYPLGKHTIPVHKKPASLQRENTIFDHLVSHLRVRSEHCMGALKGRFQCLRGLRVTINNAADHVRACRWIQVAIILHNIIIDIEGSASGAHFAPMHTHEDEEEDTGIAGEEENSSLEDSDGQEKRDRLIAELLAFRYKRQTDASFM